MVSRVIAFLLLIGYVTVAAEPTDLEREVLARLDGIRAVRTTSDEDRLRAYDEQLDEAWTYFNENREEVLPILIDQVEQELGKNNPNDYLLLDIGGFLYTGAASDSARQTGVDAILAVDADDKVVAANGQQLFLTVHAMAANHEARILPYIDEVFLRSKDREVFIAQHYLTLDPTLICAFLYGVYGEGAEEHLTTFLDDSKLVNRIIEVLFWIGTDKSVAAVERTLQKHRHHETFARALLFIVQSGGREGVDWVLSLDPKALDGKSRKYLEEFKSSMGELTYEAMKSEFEGMPGEEKLSDDEVKLRLAKMYDNYGVDNETNPLAILNSQLPKEYLIAELARIRSRIFHRTSDEGLSDATTTTILLSALHYRSY